MRSKSLFLGLALAFATAPAFAQTTPKFEYATPAPPPKVKREWKATGQAGLILNNGNAENIAFSAGANASVFDGKNKGTLDVGGAYAQSTILVGDDRDGDMLISSDSEIKKQRNTTAAMWNIKLRYDRFFTPNNSLYLAASAMGNEPAGKKVVASGQAGYQRQLIKNEQHLLRLEAGYDFSFERSTLYNADPKIPDLFIHSLRLFVGYDFTFNKDSSLKLYGEVLMNLNPETGPRGRIGPFEDTRVNAGAALVTKVWDRINFRFGFTARFDNAPQARPSLALPYAPGFVPLAEKLDTIVDAGLVVTIL